MANRNEATELFVVYWQEKNGEFRGQYRCYDGNYPCNSLERARLRRSGCVGVFGDRAKKVVVATPRNGNGKFPEILPAREFRKRFKIMETRCL